MAKEAAVRRANAGPARIHVANCELLYESRSAERARTRNVGSSTMRTVLKYGVNVLTLSWHVLMAISG
jgi:hypothetical protein